MRLRSLSLRPSLFPFALTFFLAPFLAIGCGGSSTQGERSTTPLHQHDGAEEDAERGAHESVKKEEAEEERSDEHSPKRGAFLYRIDGGGAPSYLLGTIHLGVGLYESLEASEIEALSLARVVYTELAGDVDMAAIAMSFFLDEGQSLRPLIGEARFRRLAERVPNLPAEYLDRLKPWAALVFVGIGEYQRYLASIGGDPEISMDAELQALAASKHIPNPGLESAAEQLAAFDAISPEGIIALIDELLEKPAFEEAKALLSAYRAGDTDSLLEALDMEAARERAPAYYERLLRDRNLGWARTLEPELKEGGVVIGVGAAHLFYEDGLIKLFGDAGYKVVKLR